jgi:hypothetical protein
MGLYYSHKQSRFINWMIVYITFTKSTYSFRCVWAALYVVCILAVHSALVLCPSRVPEKAGINQKGVYEK